MALSLMKLAAGMVRNSAGGGSFPVDDWTRLQRFLILGSEGGSYYATPQALTLQNAQAVWRCLHKDGPRAVEQIATISESGRAARNDAAIFALVLATMAPPASAAAISAIPRVCRTGGHLLSLLAALKGKRGFGRALRRGIARWYGSREPAELAYQLLKYRQRGKWSHRDVLRLCHAVAPTPEHQALYRYAVAAGPGPRQVQRGYERVDDYPAVEALPALVQSFEKMRASKNEDQIRRCLEADPNLSWEMVPAEFLGSGLVWSSLLPNLAMTALVRNLGRLTANMALPARGAVTTDVCRRLTSPEALAKARLHPLALLTALQAYRYGRSLSGLVWRPIPQVVEALEEAFHLSFGNTRPAGKRTLLALDVSGSMTTPVASLSSVSCRVASAAMAMVTARLEPWTQVMAFTSRFVPLEVGRHDRLQTVLDRTDNLSFGGTDCSLPMQWALQNKVTVDTFIVYTDSETWCGRTTPAEALQAYRQKTGIQARLVVVGMVSNGFSIADPNDRGMLDVVGFDTAAPELISAFSRGEI